MHASRVALAAAMAAASFQAVAADPTAAINRTFAEYTGSGPIGNNDINDDKTVYWFKEAAGSYDGQSVQSWFVFWDPRGTLQAGGSITFDSPILALLDDKAELIASAALQKAGVTYDYSNSAVGLEAGDKTGTSFAGSTLTFDWTASSPGDHVRVLVAVPEPQTYALMAAGLAAVGAVARRRRAA